MENLRSDLIKGSTGIEEDDELFYEEIEAPKFVDLTVPDRSRQDDSSWFCVRIGCNQQHEQVDPDALNKNFMLRVMAARSPNLRLRKAMNRRDMRSISKCPHSAPAKSTKDRITRFSTVTAIPEKMGMAKLRNHPISSLRSTPKPIKAVVKPVASEKALTTPRNKKCPSNQDRFRSVKYQKAPITASKNRSVAKALFFHTPKKTSEITTKPVTPISDVCAEMKQLKLGSLTKTNIPRGRLCKSSRCAAYDPNSSAMSSKKAEESAMNSKKESEGCQQTCNQSMLQEGVLHGSSNRETDGKLSNVSISMTKVEGQVSSTVGSDSKESDGSRTHQNSEENAEKSSNASGTTENESVENPTNADDNKENVADKCNTRDLNINITSSECASLRFETYENLPQMAKSIKSRSKIFQENKAPGGKHKRTTNPKPFRLRTDERGILREANLEKRLQLEAQKEGPSALRCGDGTQNGVKNGHTKVVIIARAKLATNSPQCQKLENSRGKAIEKTQNKILKMASSRQLTKSQSVTTTRMAPISQVLRDKETLTTISRLKVAASAKTRIENTTIGQRKYPETFLKEPNFQKIHLSKGCTKRPEIAIS